MTGFYCKVKEGDWPDFAELLERVSDVRWCGVSHVLPSEYAPRKKEIWFNYHEPALSQKLTQDEGGKEYKVSKIEFINRVAMAVPKSGREVK